MWNEVVFAHVFEGVAVVDARGDGHERGVEQSRLCLGPARPIPERRTLGHLLLLRGVEGV